MIGPIFIKLGRAPAMISSFMDLFSEIWVEMTEFLPVSYKLTLHVSILFCNDP
jgi:hypothetical protein